MQNGKVKLAIIVIIVASLAIGAAIIHVQTDTTPTITPTPTQLPTATHTPEFLATPTQSPTPSASQIPHFESLEIKVKVTPWGDMYRTEPDCSQDFSVELFNPNQNTFFTTSTFNIVFHAGAFFWIVEKAYFTSDLFSGQRWIDISKTQYTTDLQKTFTFNLSNVPEGSHYLTLTVIFHEGTRNNSTAYFNVNTG
jgi:hypothetical protein